MNSFLGYIGRRGAQLLCISFVSALLLSLPASAEETKIGVLVPLTGSAASMGESLQGVVKLAHLKHLTPIFEDDRCDPKFALSSYLKLRSEGVHIFYMACSGSILAIAPHAKRNNDLIVTTYAGSSKIRETGDEVVRLNPDAISIADGLAKVISFEQRPVVILHEEQEYASSLSIRLQELLGKDVLDRISYRPDSASFNAEILRIKQRQPKSLVFIPVGDVAARTVLKQITQLGLAIPVIGEVNLCDFPFKPSEFGLHGRCVAARFSGPNYTKFIADYTALLGHAPGYPFYDAMALDLFSFLDQAFQKSKNLTQVKTGLLAGFKGDYASYRLTPNGEAESSAEYLATSDY